MTHTRRDLFELTDSFQDVILNKGAKSRAERTRVPMADCIKLLEGSPIFQSKTVPPSTMMVWPVTNRLASEARYNTVPARSLVLRFFCSA